MAQISVVGSVNLDLVATAPRLPRPGETITEAEFARHPGGKGANQALAARWLGAEVRLVACVGDDPEAGIATSTLRDAGVDLSGCRQIATAPTGVALIVVDAHGENQIVVAPGANRHLSADDIDVTGADVVVTQLEVPVEAVIAAVEASSFAVVNAAPARTLPAALLASCDVVVVNQTEAAFFGDALDAVAVVVTTLGADGAVARQGSRVVARAATPKVEVVDTVGAGDTFVGALAVELAGGAELGQALRFACAAGALATTRPGAQSAMPKREEVLTILETM